jgi:hypothetical protein
VRQLRESEYNPTFYFENIHEILEQPTELANTHKYEVESLKLIRLIIKKMNKFRSRKTGQSTWIIFKKIMTIFFMN